MSARCLICGNEITADTSTEYHSACAKSLFDSSAAPSFAYSTEELNRLARNIIEARVSVPGVQPKLSVHLERAPQGGGRLTLVGLDGDYILKLPTRQYAELPEAEIAAMQALRLVVDISKNAAQIRTRTIAPLFGKGRKSGRIRLKTLAQVCDKRHLEGIRRRVRLVVCVLLLHARCDFLGRNHQSRTDNLLGIRLPEKRVGQIVFVKRFRGRDSRQLPTTSCALLGQFLLHTLTLFGKRRFWHRDSMLSSLNCKNSISYIISQKF